MELGRPFTVNVSEGEPLEDVLSYADDVYQGKTDSNGDIVIKLEKDIRGFYHQGLRTELLIMQGYDNKDKRRLISPEVQHMLTYPFTQAGFNLGYYMIFLSVEEYDEVNNCLNPDGSSPTPVKPPITSPINLYERWGHVMPLAGFNDFLTLFRPDVDCYDGSQVSIRFNVDHAMEEVYNRPNAHRVHQKCFGICWHECGHDSVNMWHDENYSMLPDHGGAYDLMGMPSYPCIMTTNRIFFCPRCRLKLKAVDPNVHCFATPEEKQDIIDNHLYWWFEGQNELYVPQIHQPQQLCENLRR